MVVLAPLSDTHCALGMTPALDTQMLCTLENVTDLELVMEETLWIVSDSFDEADKIISLTRSDRKSVV